MISDRIGEFASANPWPTAVVGGVLGLTMLGAAGYYGTKAVKLINERRKEGRLSPAQVMTTLAALAATAVGANTAWRFASSHLHISDTVERAALFLTGEMILFALALAARQNLNNKDMNRTGWPGTAVWVLSCFLAVPAWAESVDAHGNVSAAGALWRIVLGPIGAAAMWHLAMGIELRHAKPGAENNSFVAQLVRRLQQWLLAFFGIVRADQDAEDIARERARTKAANLIDRYNALSPRARKGWRGRRLMARLRKQLRTAQVSRSEEAKAELMADLAVSAHAPSLAALVHPTPWESAPQVVAAVERPALPAANPLPASSASEPSRDSVIPELQEPAVPGPRDTETEEGPDDDGPDGPGGGAPDPVDGAVQDLLQQLEADLTTVEPAAEEQQPQLDLIHVKALAEARFDTDRIRYAIGVLNTYQQPVLNGWLQQHGYTVNRGSIDKVSKKHAEQQRQSNIVPLRRSTGTTD
ncbi:hypothetical protein [Kitasatospora sp. NPDC047058]|uniref:hypothetical protein n=1 Tax=Kitasatospora sp. NPDC047058 TaxID=3155620 RepID=UPI00340706CE